jgi:hypothetical protein
MDKDKRALRKLKRDIKRTGGKRRRQYLKRQLAENPEEAASAEFEFRDDSSATLNGLDRDSTREKKDRK